MTTRDPDLAYEDPSEAIPFAFSRMCLDLHTAIPGEVVTYDSAARTATVKPAADMLLDDGSSMPRAVLSNVPVWFPAGGGFSIQWPITPGDPVLLVFAERDISGFKQTRRAGPLPSDRMHAEQDAVAIPGLIPSSVPAAVGAIEVRAPDGTRLEVRAGEVRIVATTVTVVGDLNVTGSASGASPWSPPNP